MAPSAEIVGDSRQGRVEYYEIQVSDADKTWLVQRRYSDFYRFHAQFSKSGRGQHAIKSGLKLPPKGVLGISHRLNLRNFNADRKQKLQEYLKLLLAGLDSLDSTMNEFLCEPMLAPGSPPSPSKGSPRKGNRDLTQSLTEQSILLTDFGSVAATAVDDTPGEAPEEDPEGLPATPLRSGVNRSAAVDCVQSVDVAAAASHSRGDEHPEQQHPPGAPSSPKKASLKPDSVGASSSPSRRPAKEDPLGVSSSPRRTSLQQDPLGASSLPAGRSVNQSLTLPIPARRAPPARPI